MSDNKRYYWLKLKEDFFEDDTIQWLEEQENGKEYTLFYLKLCLKSLNLDGRIVRVVGEKLIPFDKKALAKVTNTDIDTVTIAMNLFVQIGLIELLDTGEIYMKQINEMVGSETKGATRKRKYRENLEQGDNVPELSQGSPEEVPQSIESREKSLENREKNKDKPSKQASTDSEFESLWKLYPNKKGKPVALKAYKKALKDGTTFEEIETGIQNYLTYIQSNRISIGYVKHGSTWFNQQGWLDEYENGKEQRILGKVAKGESYGGLEF